MDARRVKIGQTAAAYAAISNDVVRRGRIPGDPIALPSRAARAVEVHSHVTAFEHLS